MTPINSKLLIGTASLGISVAVFGFVYFNNIGGLRKTQTSNTTPLPTASPIAVESSDAPLPPNDTVVEDNAGKEIIDLPLYRAPLGYAISAKTIKFTITSQNEPIITQITLDPATFDYRAETNYQNGFYYVHANGSVCFSKPKFINKYCLREKYTPAALSRYFIGETNLNARELNEDEDTISSLMQDMGWNPTNALASYMTRVELVIKLLREQKLQNGAVLQFKSENKVTDIGTVKDVEFLNQPENIKTQGINLASLMVIAYNGQINDEELGLPYFYMENSETDSTFVDSLGERNIDTQKYLLIQ